MRKIVPTLCLVLASAGTAYAGNGYTHSKESGVHIYRGAQGNAYSQQALQLHQQKQAAEAHQRQLEQMRRAQQKQMAEQRAAIDALAASVQNMEKRQTQPKKRRVYYGNPAFFGRNGFIGNRYHGGGTIQLPRRPRHYNRTR